MHKHTSFSQALAEANMRITCDIFLLVALFSLDMCKPAEAGSFGGEVLPGQGGTGQVGPGSDISC